MTCRIRIRTCVIGMCSSEPTSAGAHSARTSAPAAKKPAACEAMMPSAWYRLSRTCARARRFMSVYAQVAPAALLHGVQRSAPLHSLVHCLRAAN